MDYLDTNFFIRYITQDNLEQSNTAARVFEALEQEAIAVTVCEGVIVEVVQVLSSKSLYNLPRRDIQEKVGTLLNLKGLRIPNKVVYLRALDLYIVHPHLDFVDALQISHMQQAGSTSILSFDKGFDHIAHITRREA